MSDLVETALEAIRAQAIPEKAAEKAAYHKVERPYLGTANPVLDDLARSWRQSLSLPDRIALASGLWDTNIFEARVTAAKLLTQARIRPEDGTAWDLIQSWVPDFDSWAIADHVCMAGAKRLTANPDRIDAVATWVSSDHMWTRRAAFVITLPWTKQNFPKPAELAVRDRVLGWASDLADDHDWFIQKAIGWWLRDLSRHDADRTRDWLAANGDRLKAFARKEAARKLPAV